MDMTDVLSLEKFFAELEKDFGKADQYRDILIKKGII